MFSKYSKHGRSTETINLLVNGYINTRISLLIPDGIIRIITNFHGYYDITFKSNILISSKDKTELMELLSNKMNKDIKLKQIFSGNIDGFSSEMFHKKCGNKRNTVSLIINEFDTIFGGYTTKPWLQDLHYQYDKKAFLFQIKPNIKIFKPTAKNGKRAIFGNSIHMCNFDYDLIIWGNCNDNECSYSRGCSYNFKNGNELVGGFSTTNTQSFKVKDIEVFIAEIQ